MNMMRIVFEEEGFSVDSDGRWSIGEESNMLVQHSPPELSLSNRRKTVLIRICGGGRSGKQSISCENAIIAFQIQTYSRLNVVVEKLDPGCRLTSEPEEVIDWLLASDFHIVRTHLHQGLPDIGSK